MAAVSRDRLLALVPLLIPLYLCFKLLENPIPILKQWLAAVFSSNEPAVVAVDAFQSQLLAYMAMALAGYLATSRLVPSIKEYTLRKGIAGRDLGKRGTPTADTPVPEALGIVPGAVFLVCLIFCLVGYAANMQTSSTSKLLEINSALLSVCFMLFLGFSDDVLDWPWRFKLILPTVASLPLLCCYNGSTTIVVPTPFRTWLWGSDGATMFADLLGLLITVDARAEGSLIDLGYFYLLYMGMLAVFCTNAINIYAGINGLEAGQSYVIACAILVHNLVEIESGRLVDNHMFSLMTILSFTGVTLGLLRHNWYPATVFVGDTFCYFAGMTFAVVGILGHFSKTLLLFFIPQVLNFLWSVPQLFKFVPCPRHRLPFFNADTGLMEASTFPCKKHEFKWLKRNPDDEKVTNMTVINLCLQIVGPMSERNLCLCLLAFQIICCSAGFACRYYIAGFFFDK